MSLCNKFIVCLQVYNGIDLVAGHCPLKPTLFVTQRLSMIFANQELAENTVDPTQKSGKGQLDPARISLIFSKSVRLCIDWSCVYTGTIRIAPKSILQFCYECMPVWNGSCLGPIPSSV